MACKLRSHMNSLAYLFVKRHTPPSRFLVQVEPTPSPFGVCGFVSLTHVESIISACWNQSNPRSCTRVGQHSRFPVVLQNRVKRRLRRPRG